MESNPRGSEESTAPQVGPLGILGALNRICAQRHDAVANMDWDAVTDLQAKREHVLDILAERSLLGPIAAEEGC